MLLLFITTQITTNLLAQTSSQNDIKKVFDNYYEERLKLFPIEATQQGDARYNDLLPNDGSRSFIRAQHEFYTKYQRELKKYNYQKLNSDDKISYDILVDGRIQRLPISKRG